MTSPYYDIVCAKLADYVHGSDPAPLADYIVIQLDAGVPKEAFEGDLIDFLGDSAGEFVEWYAFWVGTLAVYGAITPLVCAGSSTSSGSSNRQSESTPLCG
jgi:hypothetical protein